MAPHPHVHDHALHAAHAASISELLDLDAEVLSDYWAEVMSWVRARTDGRPVHRVLDVGTGTGTGAIALADVFADAEVVAADASTEMLGRVRAKAAAGSVGDRVSTAELDLEATWPPLGTFDVVWASAVMHELADPDAAFRNIFGALDSGGLLTVAEMDGPPRFLEDAVGDGLEARIHQALHRARPADNDYPDWTRALERAGFTSVHRQSFSVDIPIDASGPGGRYAQVYLRRIQPVVADGLTASDRRMLDELVADSGPSSVRHRNDLRVRAGRTAWVARRP